MRGYIVRRLAQAIIVVFGVSIMAFGLMFLTGDPSSVMIGDDWTTEQVAEFRHRMGFDRPWYVQYGDFLSKAVRGDFGTSLRHHQPVFELIMERMPATLELAGTALLISLVISIPIGVISATRRGTWADNLVMLGAMLGQSAPVYWLGIILMLLFAVFLRWLPPGGREGFASLILPAISLASYDIARNSRMVRSCMLEVLSHDYIRTARSKGLAERTVIYKHALRNALIPVVTLVGIQLGHLLGGAVVTESVFAWPGVGRLILDGISGKDLPLVQAAVTILAMGFVGVNLMIDLLYGFLDPRVRVR